MESTASGRGTEASTEAALIQGVGATERLGRVLNDAHRRLPGALTRKWTAIASQHPQRGWAHQQANICLTGNAADLLVYEYCKLHPAARAVVVWPVAKSKDIPIDECLGRFSSVVHRKEISTTFEDLVRLVRLTYRAENWVGNIANDFEGAKTKALWCHHEGSPVTVFVIDPHAGTDLIYEKETLRNWFGLEKNSVHITDFHSDTLSICKFAFIDTIELSGS